MLLYFLAMYFWAVASCALPLWLAYERDNARLAMINMSGDGHYPEVPTNKTLFILALMALFWPVIPFYIWYRIYMDLRS